jgi:hypothetical protein
MKMYCKNCGNKVEKYYEYCEFCGAKLDSSYKSDDSKILEHDNKEKINQYDLKTKSIYSTPIYSNAIPLWKLIVFNIITLGFYSYYWYYRNWRYIRELEGIDIKPGLRTLGLFVPILGWILIYRQYKYINEYVQNTLGRHFSPGGMLAIHIVFNVIARAISAANPDIGGTLYLFILPIYFIPMAIVQYNFNLYWAEVQPNLLARHKLTIGEIIFTAIFAIFLIIWFITSLSTY